MNHTNPRTKRNAIRRGALRLRPNEVFLIIRKQTQKPIAIGFPPSNIRGAGASRSLHYFVRLPENPLHELLSCLAGCSPCLWLFSLGDCLATKLGLKLRRVLLVGNAIEQRSRCLRRARVMSY
jgi:hypothetical protein